MSTFNACSFNYCLKISDHKKVSAGLVAKTNLERRSSLRFFVNEKRNKKGVNCFQGERKKKEFAICQARSSFLQKVVEREQNT